MTNHDQIASTHITACLGILMMTLAAIAVMPTGAALQTMDTHVTGLTVSPPFINLNRETTVTLTVSSLYGGGADNYKVTVYAPDGTVVTSAWFNFTAVGSQSLLLGNATKGFGATVTQVGAYVIEADHAGTTLDYAASATLQTTNKLLVTTEFATASNPYTDLHNCPLAEEFQRGDEVIARGYAYYLSTGELLNGTIVPTAAGNVTGTLFNITKPIAYNKEGFWRAAWFIDWNTPLGTYSYTVSASDGKGNSGTGVSPPTGAHGALRIVPSTLKTTVSTTNATSGERSNAFYPGDSMGIMARSTYELHFDHNYAYTNTTKILAGTVANPGPGNSYALGPDRSGVMTAAIGSGAFNATSGAFANQLGSADLAYDATTGNWTGKWDVPAGVAPGDFSVRVTAKDGAPTANSGTATTPITTLLKPLPLVIKEIQYENHTEVKYVNQTGGSKVPSLTLPLVVGGIAVVALGLRMRRGQK